MAVDNNQRTLPPVGAAAPTLNATQRPLRRVFVRDLEITPDTWRLLQKAYPGSKIIILSVDDNDEPAAKKLAQTLFIKAFVLMN